MHRLVIKKTCLCSDSLYIFSGNAFERGLFFFVVNEGLHVLFQVKFLFG